MKKLIATKDGHTVTVMVDGTDLDVSVNGAKGPSCLELTDQLVSSLGKAKSSEHTDEYYATAGTNVEAG